MLIKEYRIPLPMSVEEYRIAQLYMIQKKSRVDSTGEGSGVEIIENCPYNDGPGGSGQYTKKIYHIGNHIPGWLKAIVPKSALQVIEEAWNAYPYTKMKTTCPFVEKFYVEVETKYLPDNGSTENVFKLTPAKLRNQTVDLIDPVKDPIPSSLYKEEEDPLLYVSKKTGRGPLTRNWLNQPQKSIMCAYKKISVEFKYWGMQNKIEQFIHDGLRRPMQMGHRQAWVWQDEWYGLTIEDIRKLEEETQRMLAKKMGKIVECSMSITHDDESTLKRRQETPRFNAERKGSSIELLSQESVEIGSAVNNNTEETIKWKIGNDSSSDDEFFDAEEILNSDSSMDEEDMTSYLSVHKNIDRLSHSGESVESSDLDSDASHETTDNHLTKSPLAKTCSSNSSASTTSSTTSHVKILMLIIHGGNALDTTLDMKSKENDCDRLKREFQNVMQNHYKEEMGRVKFRLVECPDMLKNILPALKDITPQTAEDCQQESQIPLVCSNFSISSLSILAVCSSSFPDMVESTITRANKVYREFINSEEGAGFAGEVCIVGDCMGALIAYEAMCQNQWSVSSFDTNPSMPTSPVTDMERASGNNTIAMKNSRLSSSDFDIRGSQRDLPKHVLSTEERRSVSVEDSLDCVSDVCSFKTKNLSLMSPNFLHLVLLLV